MGETFSYDDFYYSLKIHCRVISTDCLPQVKTIQLRCASKISIAVIFPKVAKHKEDFAKIKN